MCIRVFWLVGLIVLSVCAHAAQTVTGTAQSATHERLVVAADDGRVISIAPEAGAVIMRGQVGRQMRSASLLDFAPGDRIVAVVKQDGSAVSIKGFYAIVRGTVKSVAGQTIELEGGAKVRLRQGTDVVFGEGRLGKPSELRPGTLILCRLNPTTEEAWTVVATGAAPPSPAVPAVDTPKPVITMLKYTGPSPLKVRDWIRVEMEGSPGGKATFQVKGLIPITQMNEVEPGKYRASVMIPGGKPVKDAPLVARLSVNGAESEPVQAARLFTIPAETTSEVTAQAAPGEEHERLPAPEPAPKPPADKEPAARPEPAPAEPADKQDLPGVSDVVHPEPEPPKARTVVAIVTPTDGERIKRAIVVRGKAEPGSQVVVRVSYTNRQSGVLNISGEVASQLLAVDDRGQFAMGPIPLEGPLATRGLIFTIEASYPGADGSRPASVTVYGDRG